MSYLKNFPNAQIYCFEPVGTTYRQLQYRLQEYDNVQTFHLALGAKKGVGKMVLEDSSQMSFLLGTTNQQPAVEDARIEAVSLETLDSFCETKGIAHIDFLKIDTEGADLDVLQGAENMLDRHRVDVIEVESGMNRRNTRHAPFEEFLRFLSTKSYFLFGIYEQVEEWLIGAPNLRRANLVFISDHVIQAHIAVSADSQEPGVLLPGESRMTLDQCF